MLKHSTFSSMKNYKYIYWLICVFSLNGCHKAPEEADLTPQNLPAEIVLIDGDINDFNVKRDFGWDTHLEGSFDIEENYFIDEDTKLSLNASRFKGHYSGRGIVNSTINGKSMCTSHICDNTEEVGSGVWRAINYLPAEKKILWEFVNDKRDKRFKVEIKEVPEHVQITSYPKTFSVKDDNIISFKEIAENDSILCQIVIIPKSILSGKPDAGTIFTAYSFPIKAESKSLIIPGEELLNSQIVPVASSDTAFLNVVSIKRIFKKIDGSKIALTYRVHNLRPITIE